MGPCCRRAEHYKSVAQVTSRKEVVLPKDYLPNVGGRADPPDGGQGVWDDWHHGKAGRGRGQGSSSRGQLLRLELERRKECAVADPERCGTTAATRQSVGAQQVLSSRRREKDEQSKGALDQGTLREDRGRSHWP